MAAEQSMTQAIIQEAIKGTKAAIIAVGEIDSSVNNARPVYAIIRSGGPTLKEATFDLRPADKYQELCNFDIGVKNIFLTNSFSIQESKRIHIIVNFLCRL